MLEVNVVMRKLEFEMLRNEMVQRISSMYSLVADARGYVITLWAAGFTLLGFLVTKGASMPMPIALLLAFGGMLVYFCSILLLYSTAARNHENMFQMLSLSCYIRVFYEFPSLSSPEALINWETSNVMKNRCTNSKEAEGRFHTLKFNSECTVLSMISTLFLVISAVFGYWNSVRSLHKYIEVATVVLSLAIIALSVLFTYKTYKVSRLDSIYSTEQRELVDFYVERAVKLGFLSVPEGGITSIIKKVMPDE